MWWISNIWKHPPKKLNQIHKEIKKRMNSGNICCHLVQHLLSSCMLSKNINIKIYRTITLPGVLYGHETWSLTLTEEHRLRVFKNRVLRKIRGVIKNYGECCCRVWSNGKAGIFNTGSGASNLSNSVWQVSTCSAQSVGCELWLRGVF